LSKNVLRRCVTRRGVAFLTLLACIPLQPVVSVRAAALTGTNLWTGFDDGFSYNDQFNWSPNTVPNSSLTAVLFGGMDMGTGAFFSQMSGTIAMGKLMFTNSLDVTTVALQAVAPSTDLINLYGTGGVGIFQSFPRAVSIEPKVQVMADQTWQINAGSLDLVNQLDLSTRALTLTGAGTVNARAAVIASAGPITLNGGSVLNLWSDNSTTLTGGSIVVNNGTVGLGNKGAGNRPIQLNGPTAVVNNYAGASITSFAPLAGSQGTVQVSQNTFLQKGAISTTQLTKTGAGILQLGTGGVNSFSKLTIKAGTVQVAASGGTLPTGSEVVMNGGKLDVSTFAEHISKLTLLANSTLSLTANTPAASLTMDTMDLQSGVFTIEGWEGYAGQSGIGTHIYVGTALGEDLTTGVYFAGQAVGGQLIDSTTPGFKELVPVPEPGTLALLAGLGGLSLLWRRATRKS